MKERVNTLRRFGFTLTEVLVTTVVVGTLAAVVIPAMIKLAPAGDPVRVASDLGSVKMAIEVFSQQLRPLAPGDIEDLVNKITTSDKSLDGTDYRQADVDKWKGPYLQWTTADDSDLFAGDQTLFKSAGGALIHTTLYRCPAASTSYAAGSDDVPCTTFTEDGLAYVEPAYIAVKMTGIPAPAATVPGSEFKALNDVIDGASETSPATHGLLRQNASGTVFYLAAPYTAP